MSLPCGSISMTAWSSTAAWISRPLRCHVQDPDRRGCEPGPGHAAKRRACASCGDRKADVGDARNGRPDMRRGAALWFGISMAWCVRTAQTRRRPCGAAELCRLAPHPPSQNHFLAPCPPVCVICRSCKKWAPYRNLRSRRAFI